MYWSPLCVVHTYFPTARILLGKTLSNVCHIKPTLNRISFSPSHHHHYHCHRFLGAHILSSRILTTTHTYISAAGAKSRPPTAARFLACVLISIRPRARLRLRPTTQPNQKPSRNAVQRAKRCYKRHDPSTYRCVARATPNEHHHHHRSCSLTRARSPIWDPRAMMMVEFARLTRAQASPLLCVSRGARDGTRGCRGCHPLQPPT